MRAMKRGTLPADSTPLHWRTWPRTAVVMSHDVHAPGSFSTRTKVCRFGTAPQGQLPRPALDDEDSGEPIWFAVRCRRLNDASISREPGHVAMNAPRTAGEVESKRLGPGIDPSKEALNANSSERHLTGFGAHDRGFLPRREADEGADEITVHESLDQRVQHRVEVLIGHQDDARQMRSHAAIRPPDTA